MNYWLVKAEPEDLSIEQFVADETTTWSGVRNYQARNNLRAMALGDICLFYRSVVKPAVVGIAMVSKTHFQDPTTEEVAWLAVELSLIGAMPKEVSLATIKAHEQLQQMSLLRMSRLSVQPVAEDEYQIICQLGAWDVAKNS